MTKWCVYSDESGLKSRILVGQQSRSRLNILANVVLKRFRIIVRHMAGAKFAVAFDHAKHNRFSGATLAAIAVYRLLVF